MLTRVPSREEQVQLVRSHLGERGKLRSRPDRPRVFLAVHHVNWETPALVGGWQGLAEIVHWDWGDAYDQYAADWQSAGRAAFNAELLRRVGDAHREAPFDLFFSYLSGRWVNPETIRAIGALGIVTVNISFDDLTKFRNRREAGIYSGCAAIAPEFDLCVTSQSRGDARKYVAMGARSLFLPPGCTPALVPAEEGAAREPHILFVGQRYGVREFLVQRLRQAGLPVSVLGRGWPESGEAPVSDIV